MQKSILTLALLLGLVGATQAQKRGKTSSRDVSLGLKAGVSLTNFVGADTGPSFPLFGALGRGSANNIVGFHGGIFANIGITNLIAFQPELLYSQKGAKYSFGGFEDITLRLHYVDIPLAFHVNANGLFFEAGPQVGFLAAAKSSYGSATTDVLERYNTASFGYLVGIGYQQKQGLGVGLRYNGDFNNIPKATVIGNTTYQYRQRNSAFQLYLSYSFQGR